ncbi:hypothetical protein T492DRAFT_1144718, partial [Pavlovales sp. CCMP2436]
MTSLYRSPRRAAEADEELGGGDGQSLSQVSRYSMLALAVLLLALTAANLGSGGGQRGLPIQRSLLARDLPNAAAAEAARAGAGSRLGRAAGLSSQRRSPRVAPPKARRAPPAPRRQPESAPRSKEPPVTDTDDSWSSAAYALWSTLPSVTTHRLWSTLPSVSSGERPRSLLESVPVSLASSGELSSAAGSSSAGPKPPSHDAQRVRRLAARLLRAHMRANWLAVQLEEAREEAQNAFEAEAEALLRESASLSSRKLAGWVAFCACALGAVALVAAAREHRARGLSVRSLPGSPIRSLGSPRSPAECSLGYVPYHECSRCSLSAKSL